MTVEHYRDVGASLSNWARWGAEDERGTANLIDGSAVIAAASCIRTGERISLSIPFDLSGPQTGAYGRVNPMHHMLETGAGDQGLPGGMRFSDDFIAAPLQAGTQWDSLAHVFYDGLLYNGHDAASIDVHGASRNHIGRQVDGIVGRGVLVDVAGHVGRPWLAASHAIQPEELDAVITEQGVEVGRGDIVLIRTGYRRMYRESGDREAFMSTCPGLGIRCAAWLRERDVAVVASDNYCVEVFPPEEPDVSMPLHCVLIRDVGMTLGEMFDLERLAQHCRASGDWDFFFSGPPLNIPNAVGSPVNPIAVV